MNDDSALTVCDLVQVSFSNIRRLRTEAHLLFGQTVESIIFDLESKLGLFIPITFNTWSNSDTISDSPFVQSFIKLGREGRRANYSLTTIFSESVHFLVNIPTIISNQLFKMGFQANIFNASLYNERLSDALLLFLFCFSDGAEKEEQFLTVSDINFVVSIVLQKFLKNGNEIIFIERLKLNILIKKELALSDRLVTLATAFFESSVERLFRTSKKKQSDEVSYKSYWPRFLATLLSIITVRSSWKSFMRKFLVDLLNKCYWTSTSETIKAFDYFPDAFSKTIFFDMTVTCRVPRTVLQFIFMELLEELPASLSKSKSVKDFVLALVSLWSKSTWLEHASVEDDVALMNSINYILFFYAKRSLSVEGEVMSYILDGVTARLENTRILQFRENGMTVAAAFASTITDKEAAQHLLESDEYKICFQRWLEGENVSSSVHSRLNDSAVASDEAVELCRYSEKFPLNPDSPFFFFSPTETIADNVLLAADALPDAENELPSFGITSEEFESSIHVLKSLKECYNSLLGIGRIPNAQLIDIQRDIESGLKGLSSLLQKIESNTKLKEDISVEIGPLAPSLLKSLVGISIHAPKKKSSELHSMRYFIIVHIIAISPKISLLVLSGFLFSGSLGLLQRGEIARAIGDAAVLLAGKVPAHADEDELHHIKRCKKVYPPMQAVEKAKVHATEGKNLRKWGYTAHVPLSNKRTWNALLDHAPLFVHALLERHESDHFKFFQVTDPYTPTEILRSLIRIFQSITNGRHIVNDICRNSVDFIVLVLSEHKNQSVRKIGWITFEEIMRCWCGAPPHYFIMGDEIVLNRVTNNRSLVFSEEWMKSLSAAQILCKKLVEKSDPSTSISIQVVSNVRDLVDLQEDVFAISSTINSRILDP